MKSRFALLIFCLLTLWVPQSYAEALPNVIVMMMDDMGFNDIGAYTYPSKADPGPPPNAVIADNGNANDPNFALNLTPRIDSLATDGTRFTHFYSTSSVCTPSRAALMTGSYPARVGLPSVISAGENTGINSSEVTLPEILRQRGYFTAMSGKWHLGDQADFNPVRHGFEQYFGILYSSDMWTENPYNSAWPDLRLLQNETEVESYTTGTGYTISGPVDTIAEQSYLLEAMTENVIAAIDQAQSESRPFFIYFSPHTPHVPIHPHPDFLSVAGETDDEARYADVIREIDARVGAILDKVHDLGLDDNTLILFTSDNGPWQTRHGPGSLYQGAGSAYPFRGYKHSDWEGGHRVPFLARFPGVIPADVTLTQTAATHDIYATVAAFTGATLPGDRILDSVDFSELLKGNTTAQPHNYFYYYDSGAGNAGGIVDLTNPDAFKINLENNNLYQLGNNFSADFQESTDVSASYPDTKSALQAQLATWNSSMAARSTLNAQAVSIELESDKIFIAEGGTNSLRVRLSGSATKTVTVSHFSGDTDLSVTAGASMNFTPANWDQWQSVTLSAAGDADEVNGAATFRAEASGLHLREIYAFESESGVFNSAPSLQLTAPTVSEVHFPDRSGRLLVEVAASDDGLPVDASLTYAWSQISGPDTADFSPDNAARSFVRFPVDGTYVLRGEVSDSEFTRSVNVTVLAGPPPSIPGDERQMFYAFEEGSGTVAADSTEGLGNAFLTEDGSTPAQGPAWTEGKSGGGLNFDGNNDFVVTPSLTVNTSSGWSATAWVFLESLTGKSRVIMQQTGGNGRTWLYVNGSGQLSTYIGGSETTGGSVTPGTWHHAAMTIESGNSAQVTLYLDGNPVATSTRTLESNTGNFYLGEHKNPADSNSLNWIGQMDEVMFYSRLLTAGEISAFVDAGLPEITTFNTWMETQTGIPEGHRGPTDDYIGDGVVQLMDFALGLDPAIPAANDLPQIFADEFLSLQYRRRGGGVGQTGMNYAVDGIIYKVEFTSNLTGDWLSGSAYLTESGEPVNNHDGTETVEVKTLNTVDELGGKGFLRLKVDLY